MTASKEPHRSPEPEHRGVSVCARPRATAALLLLAVVQMAGCGLDAYAVLVPESVERCDDIPQGCGPDGTINLLVPDCPLGRVCFKFACDRHDRCYADCTATRSQCDSVFAQDLLGTCLAEFVAGDPRLDQCLALAYVYWQAVARFGGPFFGACCDAPPVASSRAARTRADQTLAPPFQDLDDDLLPDEWERTAGCDLDTLADRDGDGFNNLEEFVNGTDPCDAASIPAMPLP
jgi:hypothetical protein